ncbi:MAG: hypothetical protein HDR85_01545 [Bacteroides sp.]|nr:hypothetical protein [Bacteroides sp.]
MTIKYFISNSIARLSSSLYLRLAYIYNRKHIPNLSSPKDISEVLIKHVVDGTINKSYFLADKYLVRKYIISKGYKNLLNPLIGVYDSPDEIDFSNLPNRFAIKMNYGAGMNIICNNIKNFNYKDSIDKLHGWLNKETYSNAERHYNLIDRKILIEEFIDDGHGGFPTDYKFMCIHGKVFCVLACSSRETGHASYAPFDLDWNYLEEYDRYHRAYESIPKPVNLKEMIMIAENLSQGYDIIRVDLYSNGSKIWFGEMTLTPSGCILHGWTQKALDDMGKVYNQFIDV